jgi:hypothetical protein
VAKAQLILLLHSLGLPRASILQGYQGFRRRLRSVAAVYQGSTFEYVPAVLGGTALNFLG